MIATIAGPIAAADAPGAALSVLLVQDDSIIAVSLSPPGATDAPVAFDLVEVRKNADDVPFKSGSVSTRIASYEMLADCKTDRVRVMKATAYRDGLGVIRSEKLETDWVSVSYPESRVTSFVCGNAILRTKLEKRQFPQLTAFVQGAPGMMRDEERANAARSRPANDAPSVAPSSGVTFGGVDLANCVSPEGREKAAQQLPRDLVPYADQMSAAMYKDASIGVVQQTCLLSKIFIGGDMFADAKLIPIHYWYALGFADCKAEWTGSCERTFNVDIPKGFQICRAMYETDSRGDKAEIVVTPDGWLPGAGPSPRFTKYRIWLHSDGGYHVLDQQSANIKIHDLWILYMSDRLGNDERARRKCAMPAKPVPKPPSPPPAPKPDMVAAKVYVDTWSNNRISYVIRNPGGGPSFTHVVIDAYDTMFKKWLPLWEEDNIPLEASGSWPNDLATSGKECWRVRYENMTSAGTWQFGGILSFPQSCPYGAPPG